MIIIKLQGGLGNQMFEYALYTWLKQYRDDVKLDDSWIATHGNQHNGVELTRAFGIHYDAIPNQCGIFYRILRKLFGYDVSKGAYKEKNEGCFDAELAESLKTNKDMYIDGYWQSERYFESAKTKVREAFQFVSVPELEYGPDSVSLHVRRGDYIEYSDVYGGICTEEYYRNAIDKILKSVPNAKFYVFSDDPIWVRQSYLAEYNIEIIDENHGTDSYKDMYLMSKCHHHILANSSFSWWGAWLGSEDGIVIAPGKWNNLVDMKDIIPKSWENRE